MNSFFINLCIRWIIKIKKIVKKKLKLDMKNYIYKIIFYYLLKVIIELVG